MKFLQAMARMEGFYVAGSRANRNHNPGNIEYGTFARVHGAIASDGRFAIFACDQDGFNCLRALLVQDYASLSIREAIEKYAPANENDTDAYIRNVCEWAEVPATDLIRDVVS